MGEERLDKLIAASGRASRSEAKRLIRQGRILINGRPAASAEQKVDSETARILLDGEALCCKKYRYILLHKPAGLLSATEDPRQPTVLELLPRELQRIGLAPVGRLDKDTTGLLLLTNDGDMAHRIISPKHHVEKEYLARVEHMPDPGAEAAFREGILLGDGTKCLPARLERIGEGLVLVTLHEGKFHQVKRMLSSRGANVIGLHRLRIGGLRLPEALGSGQWVELDAKEMQKIIE